MKKSVILSVYIMLFLSLGLHSQTALLTLSGGAGFGYLSEDFEDKGNAAALHYAAPAGLIAGELGWGDFYMEMSLAVLFQPLVSTLGDASVDLSDYELNMGLDFTAIGLGYEFALNEKLKLGGAMGFHVSSLSLSPPNSDYTRLALEGYYGLIGVNVTPRLRYRINETLVATLSVPVGFDFGPMSEDVIVADSSGNLIDTGVDSSAVVTPEGLTALYKGFTCGLYMSIGYQTQMSF
jgi:hypothetical protein